MNLLSLDLSTKSSGWALFEDGELMDHGCITFIFNRPNKKNSYND